MIAGDASRQVQYAPDDLVDGCNEQPLPLVQWTPDMANIAAALKGGPETAGGARTSTCSDSLTRTTDARFLVGTSNKLIVWVLRTYSETEKVI